MFAGIVTAIGRVSEANRRPEGLSLAVESPYSDLVVGESIAVSGVCLTVTSVTGGRFTADVMGPTRDRTRLGELPAGSAVNLERSLAVGDRVGGHFVQGHVDGLGRVTRVRERGDTMYVDIELPPDVAQVTVVHGSIAVDGVSLTVNAIPEPGAVQVALIQFTRTRTTLGSVRVGDRLHIEADMIGKLVRQMLHPWLPAPAGSR
jgi:riboflavin synthase